MKNAFFNLICHSALPRWILLVIYTGLTFQGAVLAPSDIPGFFLNLNDKLMHGIQYFLLFFIAWNAFRAVSWPFVKIGSFIYCILISLIAEWIQLGIDERYATLYDVVPGCVGALLGCLLLVVITYGKDRLKGAEV